LQLLTIKETIKNPPVIYAKQANVTSGPQQINSGMAVPELPVRDQVCINSTRRQTRISLGFFLSRLGNRSAGSTSIRGLNPHT
jgi:hypothetical protein